MRLKWPILLLFFIASAHAQMYRWVDADGKVTYSDKQPPASVVKQQQKSIPSGEVSGDGLNYSLSELAKNFPVTLHTSSDCAPCNDGRTLLKKRGIPFSERTISSNEDIAQMKQAGGDGRLPFLTVGRNSQAGFEASAWNVVLTSAGYPETSQLPTNYQFSAPQPAAPSPSQEKKPVEIPKPATEPPPAQGTSLPGFRF